MTTATAAAAVEPVPDSTATDQSATVHVSKTTLFVRNLPFDCSNEALEAYFSEFGPLRGAFTVRDAADPTKSRGIGFVHFAMAEDAARVMNEIVAGKLAFNGRKLAADWAQRRTDSHPVAVAAVRRPAAAKERDTVAVKPERMTDCVQLALRFAEPLGQLGGLLVRRLQRFGPVQAIVPDERDPLRATLSFKKPEQCLRLYRKLFNHLNENLFPAAADEQGRVLTLAGVRPILPEPIKAFRLIMRNLPFSICRSTQLTDYLAPYGSVLEVSIPTVANERSSRGDKDALRGKGFAFIQYATREEAQRALEELNGTIIKSRPVAVDWAVPKSEFVSSSSAAEGAEDNDNADNTSIASSENNETEHLAFSIDTKPSRLHSNDNEIVDIEGESEVDDADIIDIEGESACEADEADENEDETDIADTFVDDHADEDATTDADADANADTNANQTQSDKSTVFIRNLSFNTDEQDLEDFFQERFPHAIIDYCKIVRHPDTGASRGTAFIKFSSNALADEVIKVAAELDSAAATPLLTDAAAASLGHLAEKRTKRGFQSLVSDPDALPTGGLVLDGRILNCTLAVARNEAAELGRRRALEKISALLNEEGRDRILDSLFVVPLDSISRDRPYQGVNVTDSKIPRLKRNLALINESLPDDRDSALSATELKARESVIQNRAKASTNNPNLIVSPCRLAVHHLPPRVTEAQLKEVMYAGVRAAREEAALPGNPYSLTPAQLKLLAQFDSASKVVAGLHQVKIVAHRSKRASNVSDSTSGAKSRGFGFVQWRHPLMALLCVRYFRRPTVWARTEISKLIESRARALARDFPDDPEAQITTPVVEFATEKMNVLSKRGKPATAAAGNNSGSAKKGNKRVKTSSTRKVPSKKSKK